MADQDQRYAWIEATLADYPAAAFQARYQRSATPFKWTFTRRELARLLAKLAGQKPEAIAA